QINVYTLADNFASLTADPTSGTTFTQYGITSFQVQYWTGSAWLDVPGGNVTGNNLVLRSFAFPAISTDRIRVLVNGALYYNSRIVELEAWSTGATSTNAAPSVSITAPANGTSYTAPASITVTASAADSDGTVASVDFYAGATKIGTATSAPYSISWSGMAAGTYSLTAVATDNLGATTTSAAVAVTVNALANSAPTVNLSAPNGTSYTAPATIALSATAADSDGTIAKVEFYAGATKIGTATSAPYTMSWASVAAGSYSITAVATDNLGATATSTPVTVTVNAPANSAPTVSLSAPNGTSYTSPATIALSATAADSDGTIAKVEFYLGATKLATVTSAPYSFSWTNVAAGSYTLTAVATDNLGASTTSASVTVTVTDVTVPTGGVNVALAANGGVASASSTVNSSYAVSAINDGERRGNNWGKGGTGSGWNDGTSGTYPDWVQITFSGVQSISQINVYTLADNFASLTADPTSG
ncbi:Ig-like domain-containing protein, partial [Pelomonas sp. KK5]|uniref:Ig-like domain-containing protein n=1 Tax=Pelomonas sp. KK5 TaxID=1855730 RepID=UPI0018E9128E